MPPPPVFLGHNLIQVPIAARFLSLMLFSTKGTRAPWRVADSMPLCLGQRMYKLVRKSYCCEKAKMLAKISGTPIGQTATT